jgi:hypothetical protein
VVAEKVLLHNGVKSQTPTKPYAVPVKEKRRESSRLKKEHSE